MFVALLVAAVAQAAPEPHALQVLRAQCRTWAADPKNPWALAHGVKLFGGGFQAADGRRATDVIVHDFLVRSATGDGGLGKPPRFGFARYGPDGTPIEPHTNLNTKALLVEAHLPLTTTFPASWGPVSLRDLAQSAKQGFVHSPQSLDYWKDVGWTLEIISATEKPGAVLVTAAGPVPVDQVFDDALVELEKETAELKAGLERQLPQVDKRKQGLYAHSCGGLHFVQGVLGWARHQSVRKRWGSRVDSQIAILFYRLESERRQYDAAAEQALRVAPQLTLAVLVQQVKFYGHFLETAARFRSDLGWAPTADQTRTIAVAKSLLDATVRELERRHDFEQLEHLRATQRQLFFDVVGDSCHAAHGLEAWR
jgi:hypothetical protein